VDPNVLKLERNKHIIWGAVSGGVVLIVLVISLLSCISYFCYKAQMTRLVLNEPAKLLKTYREQIKCESNSKTLRKKLIDKAYELANDIIQYSKDRKNSPPNGNQKRSDRGDSGTEMRELEYDCEVPATGNENETKVSTESLVDEALKAFVSDLKRSIAE
jgi:hypothetical protein